MQLSFSDGCSANAIRQYIENTPKDGTSLRAFRLYRKGETVSATFTPYRAEDRMHLYSLSKSFTSISVGIAQDMGLLNVNERMLDIFPECAPVEISENLASMTLGDVLSMQSGHEVCHLGQMRFSADAVKTFLAMPVVYKPGTKFVYSTGGTCVCGAAVEKRSGMKLNDFMDAYLFSKLGIQKPDVICTADGHHCGGTGIHLSADDILKFGMMVLHNGVYEGKRIVSEDWCRKATQKIADNSSNGSPDWVAGYGYQFWRNARGGFRGDGAYGQLLIILPEEDTVFVQLAEATDMQAEVTRIYELLDAIEGSSTQEEKDALTQSAQAVGKALSTDKRVNETHSFAPNMAGLRSASLTDDGKKLTVRFETEYGTQILTAGNGFWTECHLMLRCCNASITQLDPHFGWIEKLHFYASYTVDQDGVRILAKHADTPHTQTFLFAPDALRLSTNVGTLHPDATTVSYV